MSKNELAGVRFRINGAMIRSERELIGKSMKTMSHETGIDTACLFRIETGKAENPTTNTLMIIADYFNIKIDEFYIKETLDEMNVRIREEIREEELRAAERLNAL